MSLLKPKPLTYAQVDWHEDQPESAQFGDIYFSKEDGIAETDYVFLNANQLPDRFSTPDSQNTHVIGETGFGTGLNFLSARALWLKTADHSHVLHFISCEKFPLHIDDLSRALSPLSHQPAFTTGIEQLCNQWPDAISGFHRLQFDQGRIKLTLLFGDAAEQLAQLNARIDTWFLDGFAPAKNPEMWSDALFSQIDRLSYPGTRAATFTSAGIVKRGLQSAGFTVSKIKGFGRKREMIVAEKTRAAQTQFQQPWLKRPVPTQTQPTQTQTIQTQPTQTQRIAIIGAGVAGAATAFALAGRGIAVDIFEREAEAATQGSGNPQGALYIKLPINPTLPGEFHLRGLQYSQRLIRSLGFNDGEIANLCGLLQLAADPKDQKRLDGIAASGRFPVSFIETVDQPSASVLAGVAVEKPGHHFPSSGWIAPRRFAHRLIEMSGARLISNTQAFEIKKKDNSWSVNGKAGYSQVIICTAWETDLLETLTDIRLKPIRGQTSWVPSSSLPNLNKVICSSGYISPPLDNRYCFGASFKPGDASQVLRDDEHQHNLQLLGEILPQFAANIEFNTLSGKAASRAASPDYMPLVGPLCNAGGLRDQYEPLSKNAKAKFNGEPPWIEGLYVNLGHGSKGLVSCPLSAELIAAQIFNEPLPIEQDLVDLISPQRFTIRALKRGDLT